VHFSRDVNQIAEHLKDRTMRFALRVMRMCQTLPETWEGRFVADQLFRASARTAANYHATCRAKSHRDFVSKMGNVVEESDESVFWLTFVGRSAMNQSSEQGSLLNESRELLAIFVESAKTASANSKLSSR
jgi:four helix bundle protein